MNDSSFVDAVLIVLCIVIIGAVFWMTLGDLMFNQHAVTGRVTDVAQSYTWPDASVPHYLAQLGDGTYYPVGASAGKNLMVGHCYLLRQGAGSEVYNLFEPVPCKDGW